MANLKWLKFHKMITDHVPYHPLPCIKISSRYSSINTLNFYENLEKKTIFWRFFPIVSVFRTIPSGRVVGWILFLLLNLCGTLTLRSMYHFPISHLPFSIFKSSDRRTDGRTDGRTDILILLVYMD